MRRRSTSYEGGRGRAFSYMMGLAGGFIRAACVPVLSGCGGLGGPGELECDVAGAPAESARRTMGTFKRRGRNGFVAALRAVGPGLLQLVSDSVCDLPWHLALSPTRCSWGSVCVPPRLSGLAENSASSLGLCAGLTSEWGRWLCPIGPESRPGATDRRPGFSASGRAWTQIFIIVTGMVGRCPANRGGLPSGSATLQFGNYW